MRPTKDRVFLDSNILIYSYSSSEPGKQSIARKLISENYSIISTQVLQELVNTITRKFGFNFTDAEKVVEECCKNNALHINTDDTIVQACNVARQYGFAFYDSLILAAALEAGCKTLYTEDMHHTQKIGDNLIILNPFV